jgi:hypothetical protein
MEFDAAVRNYFRSVSDFWLDVADRWSNARKEAAKVPPAYTADMLTSDTVAVWGKAMDAWWGMLAYGPDPLLPTVFISAPLAAMPGKFGSAFITCSVPAGVAPTVSDLQHLGGGKPILAADLPPTLADGTLTLTFTNPITSPGLVVGLYQGLVSAPIAAKTVPLAVVVVQLT